jgi:cytochrome bd ubiquinol oxidase subunit II
VSIAAFVVIAFMLTMYVLLDGYDLGVAAIAPLIGRTERARDAVLASIGPFWNGNEVWLVASVAALFALFPEIYASAFSGFYLPFIVALWLLMFRGLALELRRHLPSELWREFWDAALCFSSALLIITFGVALGNLLRGLPLNAAGYFQGTFASLLNPYALLVAVFALVTLSQHGAAFVVMRVEGEPAALAMRWLEGSWWVVLILYAGVTALTLVVHGLPARGGWLLALPVLSLSALIALRVSLKRGRPGAAFIMSSAFLATLLVATAGTIYPYILPAFPPGRGGISIFAAAPSSLAVASALGVTIAGSILVLLYSSAVWQRMAGKIRVE